MAEQDRYGRWFGGDKVPSISQIKDHIPKTSGAEQDLYGSHFGGDKVPSASQIRQQLPHTSGAEQDRYGGWFGGDKAPSASQIKDHIPKTSGAEQDRYGGWFGGNKGPSLSEVRDRLPGSSGAEQDRFGSHFGSYPTNPINTTAVGLFQSTVIPSFGLHAGLSAIAYGASRFTDRVEGKDWLWATGPTINAWWWAIGARMMDGASFSQAWSSLSYPERLLLGGVTAWGARLTSRIASRSIKRGDDDPRYHAAKKDPGFWNKAPLSMFLPETVFQTLISLPFTLTFAARGACAQASPASGYSSAIRDFGVFLFSTGYALEVLADCQLESHKKNQSGLCRDGVWSIVRHPNYLGDALIHFSFPIFLLGAGLLHPIAVAGSVANYIFLRFIGGDVDNEASQETRYKKEDPAKAQEFEAYRQEKNSFWPNALELGNKWTLVCAGVGVAGVALERGVRAIL